MSKRESQNKQHESTIAALLRDKPKRGRPPRAVSRQNVYVALSQDQKEMMNRLATYLPDGLNRADLPDLAISILAAYLESLRRAVAGRKREIPEGITELESLYLLWDLPLPPASAKKKWTSIRVSPQEAIELGRAQGILNAAFNANRSQTFELGLTLLARFLEQEQLQETSMSLEEIREKILGIFL